MTALTLQMVRDKDIDAWIASALGASDLGPEAAAYVCDAQTMRFGEWRAEEDIYPASVIKIPIMAEVFHQYDRGSLLPDDRVTVAQSNQTTTAEASPFVPGYTATVEELVEFMVTKSDNTATNQLFDVLGRERVTSYMRELGLNTFLLGRKLSGSEPLIEDPEMVGRNRLPAAEAARLLTLVACDAIPGAGHQRDILSRCVHNDKLVPALRAGDRFMHKTGETDTVSHDAGILESVEGKRYVIVLYTEVEPNPDGSDATHANPAMTRWMQSMRESL